MKFSCVSLVIFLFCAFYTVLSVIVDQVYTLIFFFRQLIMINTYHFFLIVSIAYTKYLIAFSSILVLNLKKNSWKNRELSKMQFQKKMFNKNGWPPEDRKNFTLFVNFHFENTFIKFPNLKHVYVYLTATDHVVYGFFFRTAGLSVIFSLYLARWKLPIPMWTKKRGCHVMRYPLHQVFAVY